MISKAKLRYGSLGIFLIGLFFVYFVYPAIFRTVYEESLPSIIMLLIDFLTGFIPLAFIIFIVSFAAYSDKLAIRISSIAFALIFTLLSIGFAILSKGLICADSCPSWMTDTTRRFYEFVNDVWIIVYIVCAITILLFSPVLHKGKSIKTTRSKVKRIKV